MDIVVYSGPARSAKVVESLLGAHFRIEVVEPVPEAVVPAFERATVFIDASMKVPITAASITAARALKLVVTATTGADHIDQASLQARAVPLLTLKGQTEVLKDLTAAAEHSWLLLMACARKLRGAIDHVGEGGWDRVQFPGLMLKGKTLGIVGCGRIGGWIARYGAAFDMDVQAYDPEIAQLPNHVRAVGLEVLMRTSDFVSVHVNLTAATRNLVNRQLLETLKPGVVIVNTSRAELVDEAALVEGLKQGRIHAVGVDVLQGEPSIDQSVLWNYAKSHDNVVITPHIGGFCPEAVDKVVEFSCRRVLAHFGITE